MLFPHLFHLSLEVISKKMLRPLISKPYPYNLVEILANGNAITAGTLDHHAVILNTENGSHITTLRVCGAPINALAYNRAGDVLRLGKLKYLPEFSDIRLFS